MGGIVEGRFGLGCTTPPAAAMAAGTGTGEPSQDPVLVGVYSACGTGKTYVSAWIAELVRAYDLTKAGPVFQRLRADGTHLQLWLNGEPFSLPGGRLSIAERAGFDGWQPPVAPGGAYARLRRALPDLFAVAVEHSSRTPLPEELIAAAGDRTTRRLLAKALVVNVYRSRGPILTLVAIMRSAFLAVASLLGRFASMCRTVPPVRPPGMPNSTSPHWTRGPDLAWVSRVLPTAFGAWSPA
ncbi:hypothetical protein [Catenuloplanes atrovinosus]|uniref:hypothetical protein n=1 Tax=Catenuloplanes atrovinosus TaxID=137266 RepID=UPI00286B1C04|nr:hypothetical protein [Catenuloplanes atrovinosus]